jgi:trans-aconitate methyltransferase
VSDTRKAHWEHVYATKAPAEVSWYEPVPARSLELIRATGEPLAAPILDVGGGASTLVDHLLRAGYSDVSVLDVAATALDRARARLGDAAARVTWIEADVTRFRSDRELAIWHDRAVFHFLTEDDDRERYLGVLRSTLRLGGHLVLATFGPEGPTRCSGLAVRRYAEREVSALLGPGFALRSHRVDVHTTPMGTEQQFLYGWWQAAS